MLILQVNFDSVCELLPFILPELVALQGIEEICIVCAPGDEEHYRTQLAQLHDNLLNGYEGIQWAQNQAERWRRQRRRRQ